MTGSIETAASLGSGVTAQLAGQGSIGGQAEAAIGVANRALDEVLRQLQEKYTLWQQRLDAHVDQVGALPLCPPAVGGVSCLVPCILLNVSGVPRADCPSSKRSDLRIALLWFDHARVILCTITALVAY